MTQLQKMAVKTLAAILLLGLSGCTVVGAGIGAVAGSGTGVGALGGAVIGGVVGYQVGD